MIIFDNSAIIAGNPRFLSPIKVRVSKTNSSDGPRRGQKKLEKKGHVSGFVGGIPLSTLDSRIKRNHVAGASSDFLL